MGDDHGWKEGVHEHPRQRHVGVQFAPVDESRDTRRMGRSHWKDPVVHCQPGQLHDRSPGKLSHWNSPPFCTMDVTGPVPFCT